MYLSYWMIVDPDCFDQANGLAEVVRTVLHNKNENQKWAKTLNYFVIENREVSVILPIVKSAKSDVHRRFLSYVQ